MNIFASFLDFGAPELVLLLGVIVIAAVVFLLVKAFLKGYSNRNT